MYKECIQQALRFPGKQGDLTAEQLFHLPLTDLNDIAIFLDDQLETSAKKSFITKRSAANKKLKLKFDIVLDVINTKLAEAEATKQASERKAQRERLLEQLEKKDQEELNNLSRAELEERLANLDKPLEA